MRTKTSERAPGSSRSGLDEQVEPVLAFHRREAVLDAAALALRRLLLMAAGVARVLPGDLTRLTVEGRGQEERLALGRDLRDDPLDGRAEAHVEHAVGLVEHEHAHPVEAHRAARDQVLEPARRRHHDVGAASELRLLLDADTAVHGRHHEGAGARRLAECLDDLGRELARRHQHERRAAGVVRLDAVDHRQPEGKRLAGAGGRANEHVAPGEDIRYDRRLDGKGRRDSACRQGTRYGG